MIAYKEIIAKFSKKRVLVVGDLILDEYIKGSVSRISPEAPVPVVLQKGKPIYTLGGAANVAHNLKGLGAKVTIVGRIGPDSEGRLLVNGLKRKNINTKGVYIDRRITTSLKMRIIAQHQQVVRVDRETDLEVNEGPLFKKISGFIKRKINSFDAIIVSDYGKGIITPQLISFICSKAKQNNKVIVVDPKVGHFSFYEGVTAITPNKNELENAISDIKITNVNGRRLKIHRKNIRTDSDVDNAGSALVKFLRLESLLVTLGESGMRLFEKGKKPSYIETRAQEVFDVSGAGDTVVSVFTLSLASGAAKHQAADLANYAAGVVVGKMGAVPISTKELLDAIKK